MQKVLLILMTGYFCKFLLIEVPKLAYGDDIFDEVFKIFSIFWL